MNPLHFAVVVGINCYPGITNQLTSARQDAEAFAEWLRSPSEGGVPSSQVKVITADPSEEAVFSDNWNARPVRHEVIRALAQFHDMVKPVSDNDWPRTRLYLYVAGHGLAPPDGRGALVFADAKPPDYWSELLDLGDYERLYERCTPFHDVILLADCCRETPFGLPVSSQPPFTGPKRGTNRCVLGFASQYGRKAGAPLPGFGTPNRNGRGFFTSAVLEALRGQGPHDPVTGIVRTDHLADYLADRVPQLAAAHDYDQEGVTIARGSPIELAQVVVRRFAVLVRLGRGRQGSVRITRPVEQGDHVVADQQVQDTLTVQLPNGIYRAVLDDSAVTLFEVRGGDTTVEL